jgi:tripartite-type tricarboxylate transporter receptor subunit TctC
VFLSFAYASLPPALRPSWKKYLQENQVEDVFLKSRDVAPFLDEQNQLMRSVLQAAGVTVMR